MKPLTTAEIALRVALYAAIAFGTSILAVARPDHVPDWTQFGAALLSALITVRAFVDKSPAQQSTPTTENKESTPGV
jgi:hypothetical protein